MRIGVLSVNEVMFQPSNNYQIYSNSEFHKGTKGKGFLFNLDVILANC